MLRRVCWLLTGAFLALALNGQSTADDRPPNIVFILADDLGYGDLGCYGQQKIRTPNLDRLAHDGMRLTNHYAGNNVCAPSRCVLMTGKHPGHATIRDNRQAKGYPEGQEPVHEEDLQLPLLLKRHGYVLGGFGKWGLGPVGSSGDPLKQGFDRWFGYNCQAVAHNYYPTKLWNDDQPILLNNPPFKPSQKLPPDKDPNDPQSYAGYQGKEYAPDRIAEQALDFVRKHKDEPFFLYYPTTVPHLALQVPDDSLAEYAGKFEETPYTGGRAYLPHRQPRAAYAAMITRLDREIGKLLSLIEELGLDQETIVVFTSDNGPLYDRLGGTDAEFFNSTAGLRGRKGSFYEGGFRVPGIIRWDGKIVAGATSDRVTGFEDWLPTLLDLIDQGASKPAGIDGISFAPTLQGTQQPVRAFLYRESPGYGGQQCVRVGDWKAIRRGLSAKTQGKQSAIELYNLADDPSEQHDLAASKPDVVKQLSDLLAEQHTPSELFPISALDKPSSN